LLLPEVVLCPNVVTITVCKAFGRLVALQLNPHDALGELVNPSTVVGDISSTMTEYRPDMLDWAVDMKTALPLNLNVNV